MTDRQNEPLPADTRRKLRTRRPSESSSLSAYATKSNSSRVQRPGPEVRTPFQRDLDRLLYNYYTRRLARVTQVATVAKRSGNNEGDTYHMPHNRLTHSLKVGQVARRTAHYLYDDKTARNSEGIDEAGGIDFDVAEFAGRAHDIGHPPFGHAGEEVLSELAKQWELKDGFEGNAQTFRILTQLTLKGLEGDRRTRKALEQDLPRGLDLTYASLASVVKYPWGSKHTRLKGSKNRPQDKGSDDKDKFGYYDVDGPSFDDYVRPLLYLDNVGTLEAQIMDWADDVSYAVHDMEDFAFQGKIPIHAISKGRATDFWSEARNLLINSNDTSIESNADPIIEQFDDWLDDNFAAPLDQGELSYCRMSQFISLVITEASRGTSVTYDGKLKVTPHARGLITIIKHLTMYYVIKRPDMHAQQEGDKRILRAVTSELYRIAKNAQADKRTRMGKVLSQPLCESVENSIKQYRDTTVPSLRDLTQDEKTQLGVARGVIDYVASLTEDDVFNLYRLYGLSAQ